MTENRVPIEVVGVYARPAEEKNGVVSHFVLFKDKSKRRIPMFLGQCEAWAISLGLERKVPDRPYTFDAMLSCLSAAGATVTEVYINELKEETFYALVSLRVGEEVHEIDMRPSDAINLAIRIKCPILMNDEIIRAVLDGQRA